MREQLQHAARLLGAGGRACPAPARQVRLVEAEPALAGAIGQTAAEFPSVAVGSYPYYAGEPFRTVVTFEGCAAPASADAFLARVPRAAVMAVEPHVALPPSALARPAPAPLRGGAGPQ